VTIALAETSVQVPLLGTVPAATSATAPPVTRVHQDIAPGRLDG
jgi:X-Pro dipeptidyl-peptidase